jgi:folate-binding protein YgfZ
MVSDAAYQSARRHAALVDRSDRGRLVVTGPDRALYLQGLLTNDIVALNAGQGCYAAYLTPQGRMIADLFVYELGDLMLLSTPLAAKDTVLAKLEQFIFTEDVKLGDVTSSFAQMAVVGPDAAAALARVLEGATDAALTLAGLLEHGNMRARFAEQPVIVTRVTDTGEPGFDVYVETAHAAALRSALTAAGVAALDRDTAEAIRIEAGVPRFGRDMDGDTIPLEAGIETRAISFSKGCYVGQEVIIRVLHRGHGRIARKLMGLRINSGDVPTAGTPVRDGTRDIGRVTSSALSPAVKQPIALAYLHRDFLTPGTTVSVDGATAVVTELPFLHQEAN